MHSICSSPTPEPTPDAQSMVALSIKEIAVHQQAMATQFGLKEAT